MMSVLNRYVCTHTVNTSTGMHSTCIVFGKLLYSKKNFCGKKLGENLLQWNLSYPGSMVHTTVRISEISVTKNNMLLC